MRACSVPKHRNHHLEIDLSQLKADNFGLYFQGATRFSGRAVHVLFGVIHVANIKSAGKRARTAEKRRLANMALRSRMRTYIKKVISDVESGDRDAALASFKAAVPVIDNMAGKGIVHKNKAARHKSRLNKMIKAMGA